VWLDRVERANLRDEAPPAAGTIVANLMRQLLLRVAENIREYPDRLILYGLLEDEVDEVVAAFAPAHELRRVSARGWAAVLLQGNRA
jgi:ribosomal protein L11 methyltransferase